MLVRELERCPVTLALGALRVRVAGRALGVEAAGSGEELGGDAAEIGLGLDEGAQGAVGSGVESGALHFVPDFFAGGFLVAAFLTGAALAGADAAMVAS